MTDQLQILYTLNRTQYEPSLRSKLAAGINVVAEDYTGTGLAWGLGQGFELEWLEFLNSHLRREDLAILLDGQRFTQAVEVGHANETNNELTDRVRAHHQQLAARYYWPIVNANQSIEQVAKDLHHIIQPIINLK